MIKDLSNLEVAGKFKVVYQEIVNKKAGPKKTVDIDARSKAAAYQKATKLAKQGVGVKILSVEEASSAPAEILANLAINPPISQPIDGVDIHIHEPGDQPSGEHRFFTIDEMHQRGREAMAADERLRRIAERRGETLEELDALVAPQMEVLDRLVLQAQAIDENAPGFKERPSIIGKATARLRETANEDTREELKQFLISRGATFKPDMNKEFEIDFTSWRDKVSKELMGQGFVWRSARLFANAPKHIALNVTKFGNKAWLTRAKG